MQHGFLLNGQIYAIILLQEKIAEMEEFAMFILASMSLAFLYLMCKTLWESGDVLMVGSVVALMILALVTDWLTTGTTDRIK